MRRHRLTSTPPLPRIPPSQSPIPRRNPHDHHFEPYQQGRLYKTEKDKNPLDFLGIFVHNVANRPIPHNPPRRMDYANEEVWRFGDDTSARDSGSKRGGPGWRYAFRDLEDEPRKVKVQSWASAEEYHLENRL